MMPNSIEFNKTTLQSVLNVTSYIGNKQENSESNNLQSSNSWSNNQPLIVLGGCVSFVVICVLSSWIINTYLPKRRNKHEILTDELTL